MQTIITKTSSKGNELVVKLNGMNIIGSVDGVEAGYDHIEMYPQPVQVGDVTIAGYLRSAKIALTPGEVSLIKQTIKANRAATVRAMNSPAARNQPVDIAAEMEREDSAW